MVGSPFGIFAAAALTIELAAFVFSYGKHNLQGIAPEPALILPNLNLNQ